jgi:hypothetical protein
LNSFFATLKKYVLASHFCKTSRGPLSCNINVLTFGTHDAITQARLNEKEDTKMKTTLTRKGAYIGAGAGLVLFAIFGLLPGSLLGGAAGIKFAEIFFGLPLDPGILPRLIVLMSMLVGVLVSGTVIVTATSTIGWLAGAVLGTTVHENTLAAAERR